MDSQDLPLVLKPVDIMNIMRCSKPKAYDLIREAEETGMFQVRRVGRSPRVTRESFLKWLRGE